MGLPLALASLPLADTPRGGADSGFAGVTQGAIKPTDPLASMLGDMGQPPQEEENPFAGMGPLLEDPDEKVFKTTDGLVQRQELIALNHLAQDTHWTYVKLGYPWSTLTKEPNRDRYVQSLPYGSAGISIQAVPNKAWDLINKTTEALLVDFPQAEAEPGDDSEEAEAACDMANRFLAQDASEQGTNDAVLFNDRVNRALTCSSSYLECWTDPTGGGYVPLQIPAHPQAESPMNPLLGPDGMPTVSPVLRYVTSVGPDGQPTEESQFTEDATQAAPQWQPKLRAAKWQREHIRVFPETQPVENAEKVIILGYCTLSEAKRRWPKVAAMPQEELNILTDWTPPRYLALLPLFQRGRWKLTDGRDKEKQGASDERIMFYYHPYVKACPDYPKGADVVVSGAKGGLVLDRKLLSSEVEVPVKPKAEAAPQMPGAMPDAANLTAQPTEAQAPQPATKKETRCMEIPVVQITPRGDPDEQDPTGRPYIELFAGAVENNAHLALSASEVIDKNLHLEGYVRSTAPITGQQREDARATGDLIPIMTPEDKPVWGQPIPMDGAFFNFYKIAQDDIESIGSAKKAAMGQDGADEKSGKAIALATANNNVSLGGMNHAVNNAYARWCRIKIERAMADFTTAQQINYVGDDGIFKQEEWTSVDFALVGKITIKTGTGSLINPDQKVQNLAGLASAGMLTPEEAKDAARPAFSRKLGLPADPHTQRIERQITAFDKGMPSPEWAAQWQTYQEEKQAFDEQQQRAQQAAAETPTLTGVPAAPQTALVPPKMPWTPFTPMPTDTEPLIAALRRRRLSNLIDSAKFEGMPPEWQQVAIAEYERMREVESQVAQQQAAAQQPQKPKDQPQPAPGAQAA
jgi:hypothetical protein